MRWSVTSCVIADSFCEQPLHIRQSENLFGKSVKSSFVQSLCLRCNALDSCPTGDKMVCPFPAVTLFIVDGTVFKLLLFVLELDELAFVVVTVKCRGGLKVTRENERIPPYRT